MAQLTNHSGSVLLFGEVSQESCMFVQKKKKNPVGNHPSCSFVGCGAAI